MDDSAGRPSLPWIHSPHPDPAGLLAVWSPERLALVLTLVLALLTAGVVVLCPQAFDKGIRDGRMPSKARGQFYGRVVGWVCVVLVLGGAVWYFDEALFDRLGQIVGG
jgi:hypothetical protein